MKKPKKPALTKPLPGPVPKKARRRPKAPKIDVIAESRANSAKINADHNALMERLECEELKLLKAELLGLLTPAQREVAEYSGAGYRYAVELLKCILQQGYVLPPSLIPWRTS